MRPLRVLIAEDSEDDFLLVRDELRAAGFDPLLERVENGDDMRRALVSSSWDLVISDYTMPQFDALSALEVLQASTQAELPFIIVSGSIGELRAVAALKAGASNYVMKDNLDKLAPVVERELRDAQMRRERREAFEALQEAVKARDEFLSIASHELKTPLTALNLQIRSAILAMQRAKDGAVATGAPMIRKLQSVARSADRLTQLVERLLDVTRVSSGRMDLVLESVDLARVAKDTERELRAAFEDAGCELTLRTPPTLVGHWDHERLDTVLSNLLTNAAKFGAGQPVDFELEDVGEIARIRVVDRGIGISEADQARIFERFERAVPERNYGGFGVGLWLSRRIVKAHGGDIAVASSPGAGATFTVSLPKEPRP